MDEKYDLNLHSLTITVAIENPPTINADVGSNMELIWINFLKKFNSDTIIL